MILGGGKALGKIEGKKVVGKEFKALAKSLAKNLPSGRLAHIVEEHGFGVANSKSKFLQNADIPALISEAKGIINNSDNFKSQAAKSIDYLSNNKEVQSVVIELNMGRKIGTNANGNGEYSILRLIVAESGEIFSAIPVATNSII